MATEVQLPALSPTMAEGKIVKWLKKEGDSVSSGEAIAEVETDKSNLEVESFDDGVLLKILVKEGETGKVGAPIAVIGAKGEKVEAAAKAAARPAPRSRQPRSRPLLPRRGASSQSRRSARRSRAVRRRSSPFAGRRRRRLPRRRTTVGSAPRRSPSGWHARRGSTSRACRARVPAAAS